jgi:hypothetical protein
VTIFLMRYLLIITHITISVINDLKIFIGSCYLKRCLFQSFI